MKIFYIAKNKNYINTFCLGGGGEGTNQLNLIDVTYQEETQSVIGLVIRQGQDIQCRTKKKSLPHFQ